MITVTIEFCKWCNSPRPIKCTGAENIPPGEHVAKLQISHGICIPCGTKFSDRIGSPDVTPNVTSRSDNRDGK